MKWLCQLNRSEARPAALFRQYRNYWRGQLIRWVNGVVTSLLPELCVVKSLVCELFSSSKWPSLSRIVPSIPKSPMFQICGFYFQWYCHWYIDASSLRQNYPNKGPPQQILLVYLFLSYIFFARSAAFWQNEHVKAKNYTLVSSTCLPPCWIRCKLRKHGVIRIEQSGSAQSITGVSSQKPTKKDTASSIWVEESNTDNRLDRQRSVI